MPAGITKSALLTIAPGADPAIIDGILQNQQLLGKYGISHPKEKQHFFAQCAAETIGYTRLEENLFYTTANRLMAVWPSRFKSVAAAQPFLRNPQKLANAVYGGRLGNTGPDDGWRFRGSGMKQTTGFTNFMAVERATGLPVTNTPEMLRRFHEALESACIYWRDNNLSRFARADDVVGLTRAIQGGSGGLADRRIYTERAGRVNWDTGRGIVTPTPPASVEPILRRGSTGPAVRKAQTLLEQHGYEIAIDGDFGGGTDNITREFQQAKGLMADGVIGPRTWEALKAQPTPKEPEVEAARSLIARIIEIIAAIFGRKD